MDQGVEIIDDDAVKAQIQRQVRRVQAKSLAVALAATAAAVWMVDGR